MPTTNISQITSDVIDSVRFFRIEQRRFVAEYSIALFLSAHKNTSRLAHFCSSSQSSISRMLSSQSLSTRDLSYARVDYISRFLQENSLEFKYIILDETVMKRRGKRIENLGKFYSTIENRIVSGVSLLSAIGWVKDKLYFPLFSSLRDEENLTDQFIRMLERIPFKDTILMMDGGILCSEIFLKARDMGFTVIGRLNPVMNVIFQGLKLHLSKLRGKTRGLSSIIVKIPKYNNATVKLVFHNTDQENRIILSSDTSLTDWEILEHYRKRNYIETYFKAVKQNFGLKAQVFSSTSFQKHVELVQLAFTTWMIANFYRSVKDQVSLRDFLEEIKFDYFIHLVRSSSAADSSILFLLPRFFNSKCIS
jgi:hypothetical protein